MTQEAQKDFNAMLRQPRDMPRVQTVTDPGTIAKYGGSRMLLAPPLAYDAVMRTVPFGRLTTAGEIRAHLARRHPRPAGAAGGGGPHRGLPGADPAAVVRPGLRTVAVPPVRMRKQADFVNFFPGELLFFSLVVR